LVYEADIYSQCLTLCIAELVWKSSVDHNTVSRCRGDIVALCLADLVVSASQLQSLASLVLGRSIETSQLCDQCLFGSLRRLLWDRPPSGWNLLGVQCSHKKEAYK
jgi:hypothetical protein